MTDTHARLAEFYGFGGTAPPTHRWVQSASANHVNGLIWKAAPAELLFVHDLGDSAHSWDGIAMHLDRPLVAIDLPGHGQSSAAKPGSFSPAKTAAGLLDAIQSFAPAASAIVATGFGAAVAVHAANRRPALFRSLVILDGSPGASGIGPLIDDDGFDDLDSVIERIRVLSPERPPAVTANAAATATREVGTRLVWRYQLGPVGPETEDGLPSWAATMTSVARPPIPLTIIAADASRPNDPLVRAMIERWHDIETVSIGGPSTDLQARSPGLVADAIRGIIGDADRLESP